MHSIQQPSPSATIYIRRKIPLKFLWPGPKRTLGPGVKNAWVILFGQETGNHVTRHFGKITLDPILPCLFDDIKSSH
jgi:hypothetical protein